MLFGIGFAISAVFVYFTMYRNRDLPAFWPQGKVKEKIAHSTRANENDSCYYSCLGWDEVQLKSAINEGEVHFRKSDPRDEPCSKYMIEVQNPKLNKIFVRISSCDSTFSVVNVFADDAQKQLCECK